MLGMFRINDMSQDFMDHSFAKVSSMAELRGEMGAIRQYEKDMIIGYEKPEAVKAAHAKWVESQDKAKKIANKFLEGEEDSDNPVVLIQSASLNLKYPSGLSLSKPCAALRQAQRERSK